MMNLKLLTINQQTLKLLTINQQTLNTQFAFKVAINNYVIDATIFMMSSHQSCVSFRYKL